MIPGKVCSREDIIRLLSSIGGLVKSSTIVYVLGAALILRGIKDSTIDIDIIADNLKSYNAIVEALTALGFHRETKMKFVNMRTNEIVDLDYGKFIRLRLYDVMKERAEFLGSFGNLQAFILSNEHIIFFKSLTERKKDIEDIKTILKKGNINWRILVRDAVFITKMELKERKEKGILLVYELYTSLRIIRNSHPELIPKNVMVELERYAEKYFSKWINLKRRKSPEYRYSNYQYRDLEKNI
ncbi:MAG: hypothetical protein B6U76_04425 [Desulfurococcales archaeon ex4484_217_2]|nr:MAG: hypothetical protein B6U76_04425 [Desulfurococcales archaeon ex4484_217_2]